MPLTILTIPSVFCKILESFFECGSHLQSPPPQLPGSSIKASPVYLRNVSGISPLLCIPTLLLLLDFDYLGLNHFNRFLTRFHASCISPPPAQTQECHSSAKTKHSPHSWPPSTQTCGNSPQQLEYSFNHFHDCWSLPFQPSVQSTPVFQLLKLGQLPLFEYTPGFFKWPCLFCSFCSFTLDFSPSFTC